MNPVIGCIRREVQDFTRVFNDIHDDTMRFLNEADRLADDIITTYRCASQNLDSLLHRQQGNHGSSYRHDPVTTTYTSIIDGERDHTWRSRYNSFTGYDAGLSEPQAAYLHGYLDANTYLNDQHPRLATRFHNHVNHVSLGQSTRSRTATPRTRYV